MWLIIISFLICVVPIRLVLFKKMHKYGLWGIDFFLNYLIGISVIVLLMSIRDMSAHHSKIIFATSFLWIFMEVILCIFNTAALFRKIGLVRPKSGIKP